MGGGASTDKKPADSEGAGGAKPGQASNDASRGNEAQAAAAGGEHKPEAPAKADAHTKVPLQLRRLPVARLQEVSAALAVLKSNGLSESVNVEELLGVIRGSVSPVEGFISSYAEMCDWARTPNMWAKAAGPLDPSGGFQLSAKSVGERAQALAEHEKAQAKAREAANAAPMEGEEVDWEARKAKHIKSSNVRKLYRQRDKDGYGNTGGANWKAHFKIWWTTQVEAGVELRRLADEAYAPKSLGVGPGALFAFMPKGKAVAPFSPKKRKIVARTDAAGVQAGGSGKALCTAMVHVGAAGCGIGAALWSRLMREHQVSAEGARAQGAFGLPRAHFEEAPDGRLVPRGVFVCDGAEGLEPARQLGCFAEDDLVGQEGFTANSLYDLYMPQDDKAKLLFDVTAERVRKQVERMDSSRSIILTHSAVEACGAGLTMRLLRHLCDDFPKASRIAASIVQPSSEVSSGEIHSLLGSVRCHRTLVEHTDYHIYMDHAALRNICSSRMPCGLGIASPTLADQYGVVANVLAAWTSPFRLGPCVAASDGSLRLDTRKVATNLVPYPRINTMLASFAPLRPEKSGPNLDGQSALVQGGMQHGCLSSVNATEGKFIAAGMSCRGVQHYSVTQGLQAIKANRKIQFVDWCPTGFSVGTHSDPTVPKDGECACLVNTTAVGGLLSKWAEAMAARAEEWKKVQWESAEKRGAVEEDLEDLTRRVQDYEEVAAETAEGEEEEEEG